MKVESIFSFSYDKKAKSTSSPNVKLASLCYALAYILGLFSPFQRLPWVPSHESMCILGSGMSLLIAPLIPVFCVCGVQVWLHPRNSLQGVTVTE